MSLLSHHFLRAVKPQASLFRIRECSSPMIKNSAGAHFVNLSHMSARSFASAALVENIKTLRKKTGAPIKQIKAALEETDNDLEKAQVLLREKGTSKGAKGALSTGVVNFGISPCKTKALLFELNCRTDFLARGDMFFETRCEISKKGVHLIDESTAKDPELLKQKVLEMKIVHKEEEEVKELSVQDRLKHIEWIAGEPIVLRRTKAVTLPSHGVIAGYSSGSGCCAIAAIEAEGEVKDLARVSEVATDVATHAAAFKPKSINELMSQTMEVIGDFTTKEYIEDESKDIGQKLSIKECVLYEVGEGLEIKEEDFAAEVEAAVRAAKK